MTETRGGCLLLFSMQRSGTNWLMETLGLVDGVLCMRELFNSRGAYGINGRKGVMAKALARKLEKPTVEERDPDLIHYVREDPVRTIDLLQSSACEAGMLWTGLTLFDCQLAEAEIKALLSHPNTFPILLKRRHMSRFVSLTKARSLGAWKRKDTTSFKPEISLNEFWQEVEIAENWFQNVEEMIADTYCARPARLYYDKHIRGGAQSSLDRLSEAFPDLPLSPETPPPAAKLVRQDQCDDVFLRFQNGSEIRAELSRMGLLNAALSYPGGS